MAMTTGLKLEQCIESKGNILSIQGTKGPNTLRASLITLHLTARNLASFTRWRSVAGPSYKAWSSEAAWNRDWGCATIG